MSQQPEESQVSNPPGLAQISYRADDFTGFRRSLLRPLPGEQAIGVWRPTPGDLGLQVLEWWAYLGDVLTFYNERIANESYLRTATQPDSIANLVALLGYAPGPGLAATGTVAVIGSAANQGLPLVIPAGLRLSSTAAPGVPAQTFEAAAASFGGPSSVPVTLPPDPSLQLGADGAVPSVLLAGPVSGVRAGDRLVLASTGFSGQNDAWSLVTVGGTAPLADPGSGVVSTLVTFSAAARGPAAAGPLPGQATGYRLLRSGAATALWNRGAPVSGEAVVTQATGPSGQAALTVHLAAAIRAISPGDIVLLDRGSGAPSALGVVTGTSEVLWAVPYPASVTPAPNPPDIIVTHTALTVATADGAALAQADPAAVTLRYAFADVGTLTGIPAAALASLPVTVAVPAGYAPDPPAATAFLAGATGAGMLVTVTSAGSGQVTLTAAGNPPSAIGKPMPVPLTLLTHLLPVTRGTTVTGEVLGSGNAALASQSFTLANSPLTYLAAGAGAVSTLAVYVDGVQWQEVPSFYLQAPNARVFVVSRSTDQSVTTVTFGDGVNGARLTSGSGNVVASYRYGSGAASPPAGSLTTILQPQPGLTAVQNPVAVGGGADPQSPQDVRADAPASVFTFGRAISADDYQTIAGQAPGVSRVAASWAYDPGSRRALVAVYVDGGPAGAAAASAALTGADDPNRPVLVSAATAIELTLSCTLVVAAGRLVPDVVAAATAAVSDGAGGLFSPDRMAIGQRLYRSAVDAALMVDGVAAVHDLTVTGGGLTLGDYLDPGPGAFFALPAAGLTITGVSAGG
jgi:predicted phage baseplate assembly protein